MELFQEYVDLLYMIYNYYLQIKINIEMANKESFHLNNIPKR